MPTNKENKDLKVSAKATAGLTDGLSQAKPCLAMPEGEID